MPDYLMARHQWLLGQLRRMAELYGRWADGEPEGDVADIYRRTQERIQNLLEKRDLKGNPAPLGEHKETP